MRRLALIFVVAIAACNSSSKIEGTWTRTQWDKGSGWEEGPESHLDFSEGGTLRNWGTKHGGESYDKIQKFFVSDGVVYRCPEKAATCTADNSIYSARVEFTGDSELVLYDGITVAKEEAIKHRYKRGE